jgi:hypothetical protein
MTQQCASGINIRWISRNAPDLQETARELPGDVKLAASEADKQAE